MSLYLPRAFSVVVGFGPLFGPFFVSPIFVISTDIISYSEIGTAVTTPIYLQLRMCVRQRVMQFIEEVIDSK